MAARAVSAAIRDAVLAPLVVVQVAIDHAVIDRVAIDRAWAVSGLALAHLDPAVHRPARRALASVVRSGLDSVSRLVRQAGRASVVRGLELVPRSQRPIGLISASVQPMDPTVNRIDGSRGGCSSCHPLSSGH
jgi:hypothetical protein